MLAAALLIWDRMSQALLFRRFIRSGSHAGLAPFNISRFSDLESGAMASSASDNIKNERVRPIQSVIMTEWEVRRTVNVGIFALGMYTSMTSSAFL